MREFPSAFIVLHGKGSHNPWGNSHQTARLIPKNTLKDLGIIGQIFFDCDSDEQFKVAQRNVILFEALGSTPDQPLVYKIAAGLPAFNQHLLHRIANYSKIAAGLELLQQHIGILKPQKDHTREVKPKISPMRPSAEEQEFRAATPPYLWGRFRHPILGQN